MPFQYGRQTAAQAVGVGNLPQSGGVIVIIVVDDAAGQLATFGRMCQQAAAAEDGSVRTDGKNSFNTQPPEGG